MAALRGGGYSRVQHEAVCGVDGGGVGGAGAPTAASRLSGAPMAVVVVALLPLPPCLDVAGEFQMLEVLYVAPNSSYLISCLESSHSLFVLAISGHSNAPSIGFRTM